MSNVLILFKAWDSILECFAEELAVPSKPLPTQSIKAIFDDVQVKDRPSQSDFYRPRYTMLALTFFKCVEIFLFAMNLARTSSYSPRSRYRPNLGEKVAYSWVIASACKTGRVSCYRLGHSTKSISKIKLTNEDTVNPIRRRNRPQR